MRHRAAHHPAFMPALLVILVLGGLLLSLPLYAALGQGPDDDTDTGAAYADRQTMLTNMVAGVIIPMHEAFIAEAQALADAVTAFTTDPTPATLGAAQSAWYAASDAWEQCAIVSPGIEYMLVHNQINKHPLNIDFVEGFIAGDDDLTPAFVAGIGSTSKGLPAIEYLIFAPEDEAALLAGFTTDNLAERRRAYLDALAQDVVAQGEALLDLWTAALDEIASPYAQIDDELYMTWGWTSVFGHELSNALETMLINTLGHPSGRTSGGDPRPDLVNAPYADYSTQQMIHNLQAFERIFTGETFENVEVEGAGLGLDDYLASLDAQYEGEPLQDVIIAQADALIATLESLDAPLSEAVQTESETVLAAYDQLHTLIVYLQVDMVNQLGISLTFGDNDGD
jgi:predicted lipoprotein